MRTWSDIAAPVWILCCLCLGACSRIGRSDDVDDSGESKVTAPVVHDSATRIEHPKSRRLHGDENRSSNPTGGQEASPTQSPVLTVSEAQRVALLRYPELGHKDSSFNSAFLHLYDRYKKEKPEMFASATWPLRLAEEVASTLKVSPAASTANATREGGKTVPDSSPKNSPPPEKDFAAYASSLVIVQGDSAAGSGFIGNLEGRPAVYTNAHVLSGNGHPSLKLLNGEVVVPGQLSVAKDADAAAFKVADKYKGLPLCNQVDAVVKVGDAVLVLGNSAGQEVATELRGVVKGVGPRKIEVDAKFVTGNSGSPVILVKTGEVIGIATEVYVPVLDKITQDSPFRDLRRFAYRLDVIEKWDKPALSEFLREATLLAEFRELTDALWLLARDIVVNRVPTIDAHNKRLNRLAIPVRDYYERIGGSKVKSKRLDSMDAQQMLLTRLIFETTSDIALKEHLIKTGYHRGELVSERVYRDFLKDTFSKLLTQ